MVPVVVEMVVGVTDGTGWSPDTRGCCGCCCGCCCFLDLPKNLLLTLPLEATALTLFTAWEVEEDLSSSLTAAAADPSSLGAAASGADCCCLPLCLFLTLTLLLDLEEVLRFCLREPKGA